MATPPTIADTLGLSQVADQSVLERLRAYLQGKRLLLVLDQLRAPPGRGTRPRRSARSLRAAEAVGNEPRAPTYLRGVRVPGLPLALPDRARLPPSASLAAVPAVTLFVEWAAAVRPNFAVTSGNAAAVAEICIRLDGLPLAIELAAARIRLLTPGATLGRMGRLLPLLTGGTRDLPPQQRTLWGTGALRAKTNCSRCPGSRRHTDSAVAWRGTSSTHTVISPLWSSTSCTFGCVRGP